MVTPQDTFVKTRLLESGYEFDEIDYGLDTHGSKKSNCYSSFSLIIPAYNEGERINPFLEDTERKLPSSWEIIVVCDGKDNTANIVRSVSPRIKVLEFDHRIGKGGAIKEGFKASSGDVVGFVDADGAIFPDDIIRLASSVSMDTQCVVGSRWVKSSRVFVKEPLFNRFAGRIFHYLIFLTLGVRTKDTQCGLKFFSRDLVNTILPLTTITGRMFDVDLLYHTKKLGNQISEIGINWRHVEGTRLPILSAIPQMFAILIGLRFRNSNIGQKVKLWNDLIEYYKGFL